MIATPFAAAMHMLNASVPAVLANATAVHLGGEPFGVLLDRTSADPFGAAVDTAALTVAYCIANTPGIAEGGELAINGVAHIVTGQVQPDAGGWVVLSVYPKA